MHYNHFLDKWVCIACEERSMWRDVEGDIRCVKDTPLWEEVRGNSVQVSL